MEAVSDELGERSQPDVSPKREDEEWKIEDK
jgi:hypothetical protein